ncbi:hypothetical protein C8J45_11036 [Sphingomonas sp. PP-CE-3G-477]|uniref:hypothetical protein n=1 Tax=unclassified Sphingomonas TaxID=196159 RepID=UPI000D3A19DB|nr:MULTISPECIES: hypothetical protein [unclassified Sphingomonas]MBE2993560.1 hypothetical protein [Sphingomonas sp. CFBP 13603]PTQ61534.1 hypothetical protein C8J45_11036 [Sphingomonas sp. PP-CE-3G-477]
MILIAIALAQASAPFGGEFPVEALDICAANRALSGKELDKALRDAARQRGWTDVETAMLIQGCASYAEGMEEGRKSVEARIKAEQRQKQMARQQQLNQQQ